MRPAIFRFPALFLSVVGLTGIVGAWTPGTYPVAPLRMHSSGLGVNVKDRNDVIAFWNAVYQASEGFEKRMAWTGNYTGNNGVTSADFADDVERRLNYFRAMCGVPANVQVNTTATVVISPADAYKPSTSTLKSSAAQSAALLLVRNYDAANGSNLAITHDPAPSLTGWSTAAWNASAKGNFSFGFCGPTAITEYMLEQYNSDTTLSSWNSKVGHRRWCLYPPATNFATGDQPGTGLNRPPTNVFYIAQKLEEMTPPAKAVFVAYPPSGYFPASLNSPFWSLSRENANFSAATVKMTDASGTNIPIQSVESGGQYGDSSLIWKVATSAALRAVYNDTRFNVVVSGIQGVGIPTSYSYSTTLINPDRLTSNQSITGVSKLQATKSATYTFTPPMRAESLQMLISTTSKAAWKDDAETTTTSQVIDRTSSVYPLISKTANFGAFGSLTGTRAFRLTFPTVYDVTTRGVPQQIFEVKRDIIPSGKAILTFQYRRGFMTTASKLAVELSTTNGLTWTQIGKTISGIGNTYDVSSKMVSIPLPASTTPVRIRFRYFSTSGSIYTHEKAPTLPTGIFIDEISTTGCSLWKPMKTVALSKSATSYLFGAKASGLTFKKGSNWQLRLQTKLGNKWMLPGPAKRISIPL
jgi:hypothetical protein